MTLLLFSSLPKKVLRYFLKKKPWKIYKD